MIEKYELFEDGDETDDSGKKIKLYKPSTQSKATHIHYCYHDVELKLKNNYRKCRRVEL